MPVARPFQGVHEASVPGTIPALGRRTVRMSVTMWRMFDRLVVSLALAAPAAAAPVEFIHRWEPGETLRSRLTITQERETAPLPTDSSPTKKKPSGRPEDCPDLLGLDPGTSARSLTCDLTQKVVEVNADGVAHIDMTIDRLAAEADLADDDRFTFDSAKPPKQAPPPSDRAARLALLVGRTITMRIARDGSIRETTGIDALAEALTLLESDDALGHILLQQFKGREGGLDSLFNTGTSMLPREPVSRGEHWSTNTIHDWPIVGKITTTWDSTLQRIERKGNALIATIQSKANIQPTNAPPGAAGNLLPGIAIEMRPGSGEATTTFDTTAGRAVSAEMSLELPVAVRITQPETGTAEGLMQTLRTTMKHELIGPQSRR